ncbi:hypothetical protein ABK040_006836 [Willaertia magna]
MKNQSDANNQRQWNEGLEGADISIEPFLKKYKQEEQFEKTEGVDMLLKEPLNYEDGAPLGNSAGDSKNLNASNMHEGDIKLSLQEEKMIEYSMSANLTSHSTCAMQMSINTTRNKKPQKKQVSFNYSIKNYSADHPKGMVINMESELKEKKRGRPCKREMLGSVGIVFLSNCYEEM